jgi:general secretion pathway protein F
LADYLERSKALKESVINAMIYPSILILMVVGALGLLMGYVVPQFLPLFEDMGAELPLLTEVILAMGTGLREYWWVILLLIGFAVYSLQRMLSEPERRLRFDSWLLQRGLLGTLFGKLDTARLARTLATLVHNGVPLLAALSIARNVLGNSALAESVSEASEEVKRGGGLSIALSRSKRFPRLALQMIAVGEESGELDTMLTKVADTFDMEVKEHRGSAAGRAGAGRDRLSWPSSVALIMMAILIPIFESDQCSGVVRCNAVQSSPARTHCALRFKAVSA